MKKSLLKSISIILKVHPEHCKTFPDPNGKGRKRIIAQVLVDEIHKANIDFGPNPRNQSLDTKVSKAISEGLTSQPGWFLYFNRGIVLNADAADYDNKTHELKLTFSKNSINGWESPHGNLDGGHTNRVIIEKIRSGEWRNFSTSAEKQYVTLEILLGIEEEKLSALVGARNTNMPVKDLSLLVLGKDINWLTDILKKEKVHDDINWRQFDKNGDIEGQDVIAILSLLNPAMESKTRCYNGPGKLISDLKAKKDLMDGLKSTSDVAFEFLKFVDYIQFCFEDWYNEIESKNNLKSNYGNLSGLVGDGGKSELIFLKKTVRYKLVKSWLLPLAFSFARVVLEERKTPAVWYKIADRIGPKLYQTIRRQTDNVQRNLDKLGKDATAWDALEAIVWADYMSYRLAAVSK